MGASDTTLVLTSQKHIFTAILPKDLAEPDPSVWKIGSLLRVTGICSVQLDVQRSALGEGMAVPKSFQILMRSPQDVVVLRGPSWWTPEHTLILLALALVVTLLVFAWVMVLRKRVDEQTKVIRESEERFRHMALHDALTGLATRPLLQDRLDVGVAAAKRHKTDLALLMVDIDKFKQTNDTYGHPAGDEVLRVTAHRLMQAVRKSDTVARVGGDEFVVLLPDLNDPLMAEGIAAKIVKSLADPIPFAGLEVLVSVSVGVCTSTKGGLDGEALLKSADEALYQAKARGRNCFHVFTAGLH
jgi:diguanylate cyclase (GGDEF)-like protein